MIKSVGHYVSNMGKNMFFMRNMMPHEIKLVYLQ